MSINNKPIGIFDSGLGGLTVLKELKQEMPMESFIYFGDTAHLPYGNKSTTAIKSYSYQICQFLISQNIKSLIIACNTASSVAFEILQKSFSIPIFNVIDPCIEQIIASTKTKHIAVIATEATINTGIYQKKINKIDSKIKVITKACPLFVPIVEENLMNKEFSYAITNYYLKNIKNTQVDSLLLGCTHYPLLVNIIKKTIGDNINIISSSTTTARYVKESLYNKKLNTNSQKKAKDQFYVSDKPEKFNHLAKMFLNSKGIKVIQTTL